MRPESTHLPVDRFPRTGAVRHGRSFYRFTALVTVFAMLFGGILLLSAPGASARAGEEWHDDPAPAPADDMDPGTGTGSESTWVDGGITMYVIGGRLVLRGEPSTDAVVLSVLENGTAVVTTGEIANGFYGVTVNGTSGYAFGEFLSQAPTSPDAPEAVPTEDAAPPAEDVPDDGGGDAGVVPVGDTVTGYASVVDGPLNLRTGPGMGYTIIDVMPTGAYLEIMGGSSEGWLPVRYAGITGWASGQFIGTEPTTPDPGSDEGTDDGDTGSVPVPGTEPIGYATVFDGGLNLRSGPGLSYTILTVMPNGAGVAILGEAQNGFLPVSNGGTTGWAFADYLSGGVTPPVDDGDTGSEPDPTTPEPSEPDPTAPPSTGNGYDVNGDGQWSRDELVAVITDAANAYGQPVNDMIRVAACESVWDPYAVNSSSGASGLFQFMPGTWLTTPYADQDIFDPVANANAAAWMWSVGRRNEWSCQ